MKLLKSSLLGSAAAFAAIGAAHAADLPVKKAVPIEYVRVCSAYGAGFFYIPGTDTCLRLSGRARFEGGYMTSYSRQFGNGGDTSGYQGRLRINLDARTQTAYGTLRAFVRLDAGARTGYSGVGTSGTQQRIGQAFPGLGIDSFGRDQQFSNVDKAFIQFAGLTAGRASSFFDFYAHDFELAGATAGSDLASTNLLAYTATLGNGLSATISAEDPVFRRSPIYSPSNNPGGVTVNASIANFAQTNSPAPVFIGYNGATPSRFSQVDVIQRSRMPDVVGALRLDQAWGSAQISASVHELNVGNVQNGAGTGTGSNISIPHASNSYGYAVQGGLKINAPFIAPGDALYLQGAYGSGSQLYTGYSSFSGSYSQNAATIQGQKFNQFFNDATVNPFSGQLEQSTSFTVVASYLHYWSPEWRSAFFGSYGQMSFGNGARLAQGAAFSLINPNGTNSFGANAVGTPGTAFYNLSEALRDTYQFVAGGSLIWSPVKDLDIGVEGYYTQVGVRNGRVIDKDKSPTAYANVAGINAGTFVPRTTTSDGVSSFRFRVQRDF
ncbi:MULTISPECIES: porin [unclassified Methylobacterium]|uniref:porin n=1 Tax=unclassified Methylobacterium TaxID=2615210 RepID=UPI0011C1D270|nr:MULTISPECIES: porin [unclassified Methylobacterium]QEE39151.1 porin [Methylobacterium sp. WL1]TXN51823.1 porin [Methylobacterium sp. WL2]